MAKWTPLLLAAATAMLGVDGAIASEFSRNPEHSGDVVEHTTTLVTLSQNQSMAIADGNSISCNNARRHADNAYLRRFNLDGVYGEAKKFAVSEVNFGVEYANAAGPTQPILVNLYQIPKYTPLTYANMTQIGSETLALGDQQLTLINAPVTGVVDDADANDLVVEIFSPNGQAEGHIFFMGSNGSGQTALSYIAAADCGAPEPVPTYTINAAHMHIVLAVTGSGETQAVAGSWGSLKATYR